MAQIQEPSSNLCPKNHTQLLNIIESLVNDTKTSEITITFRDSFINQFNDMDDIIQTIEHYFKFLPTNTIHKILLVPEYGETSRIHFHGLIRGSRKELSSLLLWLKKRFGRSTISMIKYPERYKDYLLKENPTEYIYYDYIN